MYNVTTFDSFDLFVKELRKIPILSKEEEYSYTVQYYKYRDNTAAQIIIQSNLRLVVNIASKYKKYYNNIMDLIQEGAIGLMTALTKFDPYKGFKFVTYAKFWIEEKIQSFVKSNWSLIKIGTTKEHRELFKNKNSWEHLNEMKEQYDTEEFSFIDNYIDNSESQENKLILKQENELLKEKISCVLNKLNDKERFIVDNRIVKNKMTLQNIATHFGISGERVRQIESNLCKKLKRDLDGICIL